MLSFLMVLAIVTGVGGGGGAGRSFAPAPNTGGDARAVTVPRSMPARAPVTRVTSIQAPAMKGRHRRRYENETPLPLQPQQCPDNALDIQYQFCRPPWWADLPLVY